MVGALDKQVFDEGYIVVDFLFELLMELIAEGTVALSKSIKVPKYIRYPMIGLIVLFFIAVIAVVLITGVLMLAQSLLLGLVMIALAIVMLVMGVVEFKKTYLARKKETI